MTALLTNSKERTSASQYGHGHDAAPLVLVVEDHEDTLFLLTYLLGTRGYRVEIAKDGEEAVRMAALMCPDLILMDISLPRLNGLAATERMRELEALRAVTVVFLSGHADASFRAEALAHGGDDYLVKPFALEELERILERYIEKKSMGAGLSST